MRRGWINVASPEKVYFCFSSFADLQNPQGEFDGKACAAVGQSSLMALYDTMFSQVIIELHDHLKALYINVRHKCFLCSIVVDNVFLCKFAA